MLELLRRHSVLITSSSLVAVSLVLLIANSGGQRRIDPLGVVFLELVTPVADLMTSVSASMRRAWNGYVELVGVREEREWLRRRVRELEALADESIEIASENERLRSLLALQESLVESSVPARLTGVDAGGYFRTATLNKGRTHGVTKGMAVIASDGVVGQVVATSPRAARVLLLVDPSSGVDATVQRSRARGIVKGGSSAGCLLKFVRRQQDIRVDDRVITSGLDGIFPRGIPVGRIVSVPTIQRGLYQTAEIEPAVDLGRLEEVLVVAATAHETPPVAAPSRAEDDDETTDPDPPEAEPAEASQDA